MSRSVYQSQPSAGGACSKSDESLKIAVAVALLRNKLVRKEVPASESDAQRWKKKAKERKQEVLRLREELRIAEEWMQDDLFPQNVACKCYFFSDAGTSCLKTPCDTFDGKVSDVLRRRFLRQVRLKERRRKITGDSVLQLYFSAQISAIYRVSSRYQHIRRDFVSSRGSITSLICVSTITEFRKEDGTEQFKASVDFLAELCEKVTPEDEVRYANWSHQAIEFILDSLKNMQLNENSEAVEGIVSSLVVRMVRRMTTPRQTDENHSDGDPHIHIQHLIRKLGSNPYIGQRVLLSVSQRICALAESLLFADPFDAAFPNMTNCMFVMIHLIELLILDHLLSWPSDQQFENVLFEEWVTSVIHARKGLELLETRNGLYILYIDRVMGQLAKAVTNHPSLQKLNQELIDKLFH